jgi:hypothetical protein
MITCAVGAIERIRIDASDSGHARHAAVHQDDIRRRIPDHVDGARPVGGLANDVESTLLEQLVEPGAKQRVSSTNTTRISSAARALCEAFWIPFVLVLVEEF